jgi:hypothetical protein
MIVGMMSAFLKLNCSHQKIFYRIMNYVGISFQITDDVLNLTMAMGKGIIA